MIIKEDAALAPGHIGGRGPEAAVLGDTAGYPRPAYAWYFVGVLLIAGITSYLDRYLIALLVEPIKHDLLLNDTQISLLQGFAFAVFFVVFGLPLGAMVDRGNRRNILAAAVALWSVMTMACGFATNFVELFLARAGVGIGEACLAPAAFSLIADCFPPAKRGRAMGVYNMCNYAGAGASLLVGGLVITLIGKTAVASLPLVGDIASWKAVFIVIGAPGLLIAVWLLSLNEVPRQQTGSAKRGGGVFTQFLARLKSTPGAYVAVYANSALTAFAGLCFAVWGPTIFIRQLGMSPANVGLRLGLVTTVCGMLGSLSSGALSDWLVQRGYSSGRFLVPFVCWPLFIVGAPVVCTAQSEVTALVGSALLVLGSGLGIASVPPTIHDITPNRLRGQATALHFIFASLLGMGVAPTLIALVTDYVYRDPKALAASLLTVLIPVSILGLIVALVGQRAYAAARRKLEAEVAEQKRLSV